MPIKLILAKPEDNKEGAKIQIDFWEDRDNAPAHNLKLHQDSDGKWHPELKVSTFGCHNKDIQWVRVALAEALNEAARLIQCSEFGELQVIASLVSNEKGKE